VSKELGPRNELPAFVSVPGSTGYWESAGYLEPRFNPFDAGNPNVPKYQVRDLELPLGVDWARMDRRRSLLKLADDKFRQYDSQNLIENMNSYYQTAFGLMQSDRAKKAFLIGEESEKLRDHCPSLGGLKPSPCRRRLQHARRGICFGDAGLPMRRAHRFRDSSASGLGDQI